MKTLTTNLAIADDHEAIRCGLRAMLQECGFNVILTAHDGKDLIRQLQGQEVLPQVCVLDIDMPQLNGIQTAVRIRQFWPHIGLLAMDHYLYSPSLVSILQSGADGYLSKDAPIQEWIRAIGDLSTKGFYLSDHAYKLLLHHIRFPEGNAPGGQLTDRFATSLGRAKIS